MPGSAYAVFATSSPNTNSGKTVRIFNMCALLRVKAFRSPR
jgi:hypothetical protein